MVGVVGMVVAVVAVAVVVDVPGIRSAEADVGIVEEDERKAKAALALKADQGLGYVVGAARVEAAASANDDSSACHLALEAFQVWRHPRHIQCLSLCHLSYPTPTRGW